MLRLRFRGKELVIPGTWRLPNCYDLESDLLIELRSSRRYHHQRLTGIRRHLDAQGNFWGWVWKTSLFVIALPPPAADALCELGLQIHSYSTRTGKQLACLQGPLLWQGPDGKVYAPDYVVVDRCASEIPVDEEMVLGHTGRIAFQFGDDKCKSVWKQMVSSGAFNCVVGLIPDSLEVVVCTSAGMNVLKDPEYLDLGATMEYLRVYLGPGNSFLWPTQKKAEYYRKQGTELVEALMECIRLNKIEEAKAVIQFMPSMNYPNGAGFVPLVNAAALDQLEIVKYMCAYGGSVDLPDLLGRTARTAAKGESLLYIQAHHPPVINSGRPTWIRMGPLDKEYAWEVLDKFAAVPDIQSRRLRLPGETFVDVWLNPIRSNEDARVEQIARSCVSSDLITVHYHS